MSYKAGEDPLGKSVGQSRGKRTKVLFTVVDRLLRLSVINIKHPQLLFRLCKKEILPSMMHQLLKKSSKGRRKQEAEMYCAVMLYLNV